MHGRRPRDWDHFERTMRVWSRRFERDMRAMGEQMERDFGKFGEDFDRDGKAASEAARRDHRDAWAAWGACWGPQADWHARRAARAARRAARRSTREAARHARHGACAGMGGIWAWWWVVFPLFFLFKNAWEDAGGAPAIAEGFGRLSTWWLEFTLIGPIAHLLERATGLSFIESFTMIAISIGITAGTALIGWRTARPRPVDYDTGRAL